MEMSIFLSLAFTEKLHLVTIFYILKWNNVLFEQLHLLEPSVWQYLFLINYKEFQAPQNCSSPQPYTEGTCFIWGQKLSKMNDKNKCQINIIDKYIKNIILNYNNIIKKENILYLFFF